MSFDPSIENIIKKFNDVEKIKNILHIGACLGDEVSFYETLKPELVYWFEPNPNLLDRLNSNVSGKNFINKVFPYAVSDKKGLQNFNLIEDENKTNPGCSSLHNLKLHSEFYSHIKKIGTCTVETINLDEFLIENNLETNFDMVSMDTQGHDYVIISNSNFIINSKIIIVETSKVELYENQKTDTEIENFLLTKGFHKEYYHEFHEVWGDTLFIKK